MTTMQILEREFKFEIEQEVKIGQIVYKHHAESKDWFILNEKSYSNST